MFAVGDKVVFNSSCLILYDNQVFTVTSIDIKNSRVGIDDDVFPGWNYSHFTSLDEYNYTLRQYKINKLKERLCLK